MAGNIITQGVGMPVLAAVPPMFGLPEAGVLLILGIDHFLDMGHTAINVMGNAIAAAVVAKWEGASEPVGPALAETETAFPAPGELIPQDA